MHRVLSGIYCTHVDGRWIDMEHPYAETHNFLLSLKMKKVKLFPLPSFLCFLLPSKFCKMIQSENLVCSIPRALKIGPYSWHRRRRNGETSDFLRVEFCGQLSVLPSNSLKLGPDRAFASSSWLLPKCLWERWMDDACERRWQDNAAALHRNSLIHALGST